MNALAVVNTNLADILLLPDEQAAPALNERMVAIEWIERVHQVTYAERLIIIREFELRKLWRLLIDPEVGQPFPSLTAWLSSDSLGCRRVNFEAARAGKMLADIPAAKLIDMPKSNLHVLAQLSTAVRNDPEILDAAKNMPQNQFLAKIEKEQPHQHLEVRRPLRFSLGRSGAKAVEDWIAYALEHDIAGSRDEAIVRACEMALNEAELDEELSKMPPEEVTA